MTIAECWAGDGGGTGKAISSGPFFRRQQCLSYAHVRTRTSPCLSLLFLKRRGRDREREVEERLQKWRVCPSSLPREERRNFKADKQEVCIIPLVPEEGSEGMKRKKPGKLHV